MAIIKPFKAYRPIPEYAEEVVCLPYDVMNTEEARKMARGNPRSFLHVIRAEIDLNPKCDAYAPEVYAKAKANLQDFIWNSILMYERQESFYIYQEICNNRAQIGLVACTAVADYLSGVIKTHELTRPEKEDDRIRHIETCNAHTELIFLTYRPVAAVNAIIKHWMQTHVPIYHFATPDKVQHAVWQIDESRTLANLRQHVADIPALYIADGHHRSASAAKVGQRRRAQAQTPGELASDYFLSILYPSDQLEIMDYNRVVSDLHDLSGDDFLQQVSVKFEVEKRHRPFKPAQPRTFAMFWQGNWYQLSARAGTYPTDDPVAGLDVSILQNNLLGPILAIQDPRTDPRIDFVGGIRGLQELERRVQEGMAVAFAMYPTRVADVLAVADAGQLMPPKSTWFEPKPRSGLFVYPLF